MKQYKFIALVIVFLSVFSLNAQQKLEKLSKTVKANKDVILRLDTNQTNIEIDTWDKNEIQVEAFIESDELSKEDLKEVLESWDMQVEGSGANVSIESRGGYGGSWDFNFSGLEALDVLKDIDIIIPQIPEMPELPKMPEMPEMNIELPEMPEIPELPELPEGVHNVQFDVEKYKKEGEPYLDRWSQEFEDKYGKGYKEAMKKWAREFSKVDWDSYSVRMEKWGEKFGEKFGDKFGKSMEKWGEEFSKKFDGKWAEDMEKWGEEFGEKFGKEWEEKGKEIEERMKEFEEEWEVKGEAMEKRFEDLEKKNNKVKITIRIKMPKDTKLKVNVRHGELKFASVIHNLKADLSHSSLLAERIDGSTTSINASYSPILVNNWDEGELTLKYVDDVLLKNVKTLVLFSNSSNINIDYLSGNSIIDGSFGELTIHNILDSFSNLNVVLENSDAHIKLPKSDFDLVFKGDRSKFNGERTDKKVIKNYPNNITSNKTILVNAKYSNIVMQ
ncbi:DUF4097 domain-containing protein [Flavobacteriaceae bacterium S0825]|uniref:hypothetical protein n=1 Tax=Gaetbulibacter sp. S0825 TaxID=2720084 RepID=UPI00143025CC|nr:hypothetical protein [Gaetbulibacter sp. S0825]MCK0109001.1 DUF4097 domain-containing protein [Flavobacteriaceae bacterium S0825]NIX64636.1 hypothetical protein [Gaetbulibacter sp. S0825]